MYYWGTIKLYNYAVCKCCDWSCGSVQLVNGFADFNLSFWLKHNPRSHLTPNLNVFKSTIESGCRGGAVATPMSCMHGGSWFVLGTWGDCVVWEFVCTSLAPLQQTRDLWVLYYEYSLCERRIFQYWNNSYQDHILSTASDSHRDEENIATTRLCKEK